MPLVRISLLKGRSPETVRAIADGVHAALVDVFSVPPEDRFQIIEQRDPGEIIYSRTYLGIERTDDLVIVQVIASNWRDVGAKQALYRSITDNLTTAPGLRPQDVQVVLIPNEKIDWSFGNGVAAYPPA
jgi:phenylpyruvate tautomerase PptA (4-oxalocrotonate tautomerase family)